MSALFGGSLTSMPAPIYVVDAFAEKPFEGFPAGVCLLDSEPASDWMQKVAAEMKHSETAFVWPSEGNFGLRWFTPTVEVSLCGHATLASARVLFDRAMAINIITFSTASGLLHCSQTGDGIIEMDFPAKPPKPYGSPSLKTIANALGLKDTPVDVLAYGLDWFVVFENEAQIQAIDPDYIAIIELGLRGMVATAAAEGKEYDFVSRFFAPGSGVPEDPVTGSAHCALAPYWAGRLGRNKLTGRQLSQRGGTVGVEFMGERVMLSGHAQIILSGVLDA